MISAQCSECQRGENFKRARRNGKSNHDPLKGGQMVSPHPTTIHHSETDMQQSTTTTTPHHHTKHIIPFSTDTSRLHSKWQEACTGMPRHFFLHDANMIARQRMGHGPRTLAMRASQGRVYRESQLDERSLLSSLRREREMKNDRDREKRER